MDDIIKAVAEAIADIRAHNGEGPQDPETIAESLRLGLETAQGDRMMEAWDRFVAEWSEAA